MGVFNFSNIGLPSLPSSGIPFPNPGRLLTTVLSLTTFAWDEKWGIFDKDGNKIIDYDTFEEVGVRESSRIAGFPVQKGSFATYNKTHNSGEYGVVVSKGGLTFAGRKDFINQLYSLKNSYELINIYTPDKIFNSVNCFEFDYRITADHGSHIVTAQLKLSKVREVVNRYVESTTPTTTNAKDPGAHPAIDKGTVQPLQPQSMLADVKKAVTSRVSSLLDTAKTTAKSMMDYLRPKP